MGYAASVAAIVGSAASAGAAIYSATKGAPKVPAPPAASTSPNIDAFSTQERLGYGAWRCAVR